eukprot:gene2700-5317_t
MLGLYASTLVFATFVFGVWAKSTIPSTDNVPRRITFKEKFFTIPYPYILGAASVAIEAYSNLPLKSIHGSVPIPLESPRSGNAALVIFPGSGGPDEFTDKLLERVKAGDNSLGVKRFSTVYDWSEWRGNFLRAAYDGDAIGTQIGTQLAAEESKYGKLRSLHFIGISVGAFAADACVRGYKAETARLRNSKPAHVRLTLLDPFESKGIFRTYHGYRNFGKYADFCEQYMNGDDPVPFTNTHLPYAYTYDITRSAARKSFELPPKNSMHCWPGE